MTNNNDSREQVIISTCPVPERSGLRCGLPPTYALLEIDHGLMEPVEEWLYQCQQGHLWAIEPEPATPAWEFRLSAEILADLEILAQLEAKHRADPTAGWLPPAGPSQAERQAQHRARKQAKRQARQNRRRNRKLPPAPGRVPPADRQLEMRR